MALTVAIPDVEEIRSGDYSIVSTQGLRQDMAYKLSNSQSSYDDKTLRLLAVFLSLWLLSSVSAQQTSAPAWRTFRGISGKSGWRCHVIQPDPNDDGPDGINLHDWDGDGDLDVFANAEEGKYSRLFFNPGRSRVKDLWNDYLEFPHGPCEDSGIGDLDNDGDVDYVANGGRVYFNPGVSQVRNQAAWAVMVLFETERRVPMVYDVDGDGLNDLIVGAQEWYKQPTSGKYDANNWRKFEIGKNRWPMNCIVKDVDMDGDADIVVPDRGIETCWYENPGLNKVTQLWTRKLLHPHTDPMFMTIADVNGDMRDDFVITGGSKGLYAKQLLVLIRKIGREPKYDEFVIEQPCGLFPKGVAVAELDGDPGQKEILVVPKSGNLWTASLTPQTHVSGRLQWRTTEIDVPGAMTRKKMDNAWLGDLDSDGDLDVLTTEENGGWGVIWFENPVR